MNATLTLDKAGRIVIPKTVRDELNLSPGDTLEMESEGNQVTLRPAKAPSRLIQDRGIWVYRSSKNKKMSLESANQVLRDIYTERERRFRTGDYE